MSIKSLQSALLWAVIVVLLAAPVFLWLVPPPFFNGDIVEIENGASISSAAEKLADAGVVYTPELIEIPLRFSNSAITAGRYKFASGESAREVVQRVGSGDYQMPQAQVVIPEGFTNEQIAAEFAQELSGAFDQEAFLARAAEYEGYLFPDTYRLSETATAEDVITQMRNNFSDQIAEIRPELEQFDASLEEVIKMASLVEREAARYEDRQRVAGVLWRRLEAGMPLQVDAVFAPLIGKSTYDLTIDDLATDSPYNLYTNRGLPPTPIASPGLEAIRATINPISSESMYYLTGDDGVFYFAETLDEHQENKRTFMNTNLSN